MVETREDVLARLASRDVASLTGLGLDKSAEADKIEAYRRIIGELNVPIMQAKFVYNRLIKHLQQSDLTINFTAYKFFNQMPRGEGYVSQFEGGNRWGSSTYVDMRDDAEETMFDYSRSGTGPTRVPSAVSKRIRKLGKRSKSTFKPAIRPKYAALNYARLKYGSAGQWGKSHMILKEHVKQNCTLLHSDSFDLASGKTAKQTVPGQMANIFNLHRLIVNMPPKMLEALNSSSNGNQFGAVTQVPGLGSTAYIEAQVHGEVKFDRDIAKLKVASDELKIAEQKLQSLVDQGQSWKVIDSDKLLKIFLKFAEENKIEVEIIK